MRIVLFDIDGTLINTGGAGGAALRHAFCEEFAVDEPGQVPLRGRTDRGIGRSLFQLHGLEDSSENWRRLRDAYLARLPGCLRQCSGRVLPGVGRLLRKLSETSDVAVGLLTGNLRDGARIKLAHYGLDHHFPFGGFGDDHYDRDFVAQDALAAARRHVNGKFTSQQVWVIGDTPLDVTCARAIDARVLAVTTGSHRREELEAARPDALFADLDDTDRVLAQVTH